MSDQKDTTDNIVTQYMPISSQNINLFNSLISEAMRNGFSVTPGTMYVQFQSIKREPIGHGESEAAARGIAMFSERRYCFVQMERKILVHED